ncbi:hypothetical protein A4G18_00590 [Pasteurellaceae bacterium Pebbles2]|nr:hypothetical protein [Pasteurellaceae bacterium Pebbles2]
MNNLNVTGQANSISAKMINQQPINQMDIIVKDYTFRISSLEEKVNTIETDVSTIKSNYLTLGAFYRSGLLALIVLVGGAWALYSHTDNKYESRFSSVEQKFATIDQRFEKIDDRFQSINEKIHSIDIRLTKVEEKIDNIDDKLDILIQQKQAKN